MNFTSSMHSPPLDYPTVTTHPQPQHNVTAGSTVSFSVEAEQATNYHWHFKGDALSSNAAKYEGVRASTLSIFDVEASDVGHYSCLVGNNILSVISETAQLTLILCKCVCGGNIGYGSPLWIHHYMQEVGHINAKGSLGSKNPPRPWILIIDNCIITALHNC